MQPFYSYTILLPCTALSISRLIGVCRLKSFPKHFDRGVSKFRQPFFWNTVVEMSDDRQKSQTPRFLAHLFHFCPIFSNLFAICLTFAQLPQIYFPFLSPKSETRWEINHFCPVFSIYDKIFSICLTFEPKFSENALFLCPQTFPPRCFRFSAAVRLKHHGGYVWGNFFGGNTPLVASIPSCCSKTSLVLEFQSKFTRRLSKRCRYLQKYF